MGTNAGTSGTKEINIHFEENDERQLNLVAQDESIILSKDRELI